MRWRIAIAVLAVIGIAGAVYVGTQPKKGTVEWHKTQYLKILERVSQNTWKDKLQRAYRRVARLPQPLGESDKLFSDVIALQRHQGSLIQLGYLQCVRVFLTNPVSNDVEINGYIGRNADARHFIDIRIDGLRVVQIIAPTSDLSRIEAAIRQADVPASK